MAERAFITRDPAAPANHSATVEGFDDALSEANIITDIIGKLADGQIGGGVVPAHRSTDGSPTSSAPGSNGSRLPARPCAERGHEPHN